LTLLEAHLRAPGELTVGTPASAHTGARSQRGDHRSQMQVAGAPRAVARASRVLWTVQRARGQARERRSRDFGWVGRAGTTFEKRKNFVCPTHRNSQRRPVESWGHCSPLMFSTRLVVGHAGASRLNASNWPGARAFASTHQPVAGQTVQLAAGSVGILHGGNWGSAEALGGLRQHVP
jgi:hypothetical protein